MRLKNAFITILFAFLNGVIFAQKKGVMPVSDSVNSTQSPQLPDNDSRIVWKIGSNDLKTDRHPLFTLQTAGDAKEIRLKAVGVSKEKSQNPASII
jgi:hypothetical protein